MEKLNFKILITGRVQQVGFRFFTRRIAEEMGITGSVSNLPNGDVMVIAYGNSENIPKFISAMRKGPSRAFVSGIDLQEIPFEEVRGFRIEH